eukprot:Lithocolla_globosa_v1_NODE_7812_length_898_cov_6.421115.p1 type:complete len:226 gc:universal NODE_7812_length_898_cov_6.421115:787-110(-)
MNRRGIFPSESCPAFVKNWALVFNYPGIPFAEPSFGNVEKVEGCQVHGVLHKITEEEMNRLRISEGGRGITPGYQPVKCVSETYEGKKIECIILSSNDDVMEGLFPSQRYMKLLTEGAEKHQVEESYIDYLKTLPTIPAKFWNYFLALPFLLILGQPWIFLFIFSKFLPKNWAKVPGAWCLYYLKEQIWFFYNIFSFRFWRPVSRHALYSATPNLNQPFLKKKKN